MPTYSMRTRNEGRLVAIVDDDASVRGALEGLMKVVGLSAQTFASGEEFLASGKKDGTGCLITDVRMPGMSGLELQAKLNAADCGISTIFITAHADDKMRLKALRAGAADFVAKPFDEEALVASVRALLDRGKNVPDDNLITGASRIRVLSVDDHPLMQEGITAIINSQSDMWMVATASNGKEAIEAYRALRPDITLMDLRLPDRSGIDVMIAIRAEFPEARVIVLTTYDGDAVVQRSLEAGARGFLLKGMAPRQMIETIRQVHAGRKHIPPEIAAGLAEHFSDETLSEREVEVLHQITVGGRNREIAERLFIAEETVKVHLRHIMGKLGAHDRTHAMAIAVRRGIIHL